MASAPALLLLIGIGKQRPRHVEIRAHPDGKLQIERRDIAARVLRQRAAEPVQRLGDALRSAGDERRNGLAGGELLQAALHQRMIGRHGRILVEDGARLIGAALTVEEARISLNDADRRSAARIHRTAIGIFGLLPVAEQIVDQRLMIGLEKTERRLAVKDLQLFERELLIAISRRRPGFGERADKGDEGPLLGRCRFPSELPCNCHP